MAHTENANDVANDAITNDVGINRHQVALVGPWHNAASMWKSFEAITRFDKKGRDFLSSMRIKLLDVSPDSF